MIVGFKNTVNHARALYTALKTLKNAEKENPTEAALKAINTLTLDFCDQKLGRFAKKAVFLFTRQSISTSLKKLEKQNIEGAQKTLTLAKGHFGTKAQGFEALIEIATDLVSDNPKHTKQDLTSIAKTLSPKQIIKAIRKTNPKHTPLQKFTLLSLIQFGRASTNNLSANLEATALKEADLSPVDKKEDPPKSAYPRKFILSPARRT